MTFRKAKALNLILISSWDTVVCMNKAEIAANVCIYKHTHVSESKMPLSYMLAHAVFRMLLMIYYVLFSKVYNICATTQFCLSTPLAFGLLILMCMLDFDFAPFKNLLKGSLKRICNIWQSEQKLPLFHIILCLSLLFQDLHCQPFLKHVCLIAL